MMNLLNLINSVPDSSDLDAMSDWFCVVSLWAQKNDKTEILENAKSGLFFVNVEPRVIEFRRKILSQLKALKKEGSFVMNTKSKIFIVHGHDDGLKESVARFVEKQGFEAVILHEQANTGRTIIEKLEDITEDVKYAIILYTPDDSGEDGKKRARQNVVFEHGYFTAKLGRARTCVIMGENVEKPSDNQGVIYISEKNWRIELCRELKAAGLPADANLI